MRPTRHGAEDRKIRNSRTILSNEMAIARESLIRKLSALFRLFQFFFSSLRKSAGLTCPVSYQRNFRLQITLAISSGRNVPDTPIKKVL